MIPKDILRRLPGSKGGVSRERNDWVDWDETEAVASGQGPIYVTTDENHHHETVRKEISSKLRSLTDKQGRKVARRVVEGKSIYRGSFDEEAPDIVIDQAPHLHIAGDPGREKVFLTPKQIGWRAENKRTAMFAATGPAFASGELDELSILDLAPTMLHLFGHSVPEDMDGTVRREVFDRETEAYDREVSFHEPSPVLKERTRIRQAARRLRL